jgi:pimeloyl-ACP methyl ester carboxylesterase
MNGVATSPDGIQIAYEVEGTGRPAIVLVHGWSCDRTYWRHQVGAFPANRVVAIDLAGHGESGFGRDSWTMPAFGADVAAVVDALGLDDVVLVGHSMGGDVILEAALLLDERVRGLVWVDTYSSLGETEDTDEIDALVARLRVDFLSAARAFVGEMFGPNSDRELVEWVVADMSAAPPEIAIDALRHTLGYDAPAIDALSRLSAPVVAINPDYEPTDETSLLRHGVRTVLVTGVSHFLMLEDPGQFNRVLTEVVADFGQR